MQTPMSESVARVSGSNHKCSSRSTLVCILCVTSKYNPPFIRKCWESDLWWGSTRSKFEKSVCCFWNFVSKPKVLKKSKFLLSVCVSLKKSSLNVPWMFPESWNFRLIWAPTPTEIRNEMRLRLQEYKCSLRFLPEEPTRVKKMKFTFLLLSFCFHFCTRNLMKDSGYQTRTPISVKKNEIQFLLSNL